MIPCASAFLTAAFVVYMWLVSRVPSEEPELVGPARLIGAMPAAVKALPRIDTEALSRKPLFVAARGVAGAHRGGDVVVESFSKGHRIGTSSPDGAGRLVDAGAIPDRPVEPPVSRS